MKKQVRSTIKKIVFLMTVVFITATTFSSCKKGDTPDPAPAKEDPSAIIISSKWNVTGSELKIDGTWKAKPVTLSLKQFLQFNDIVFKKGGAIQISSQAGDNIKQLGGTWTLNAKALIIDPDDMKPITYTVETLDKNSLIITFEANTGMMDPENENNYIQVTTIRLKLTQ